MKIKLIIVLMVLSFITFGFGITYMYFNTSSSGFFNEGVAGFVFNVEKQDKIEIPLNDLTPGENRTFNFSVTNTEKKVVSDVSIDYQIILKTYHFAPLDIELYKVNKENEELILKCDETFSRNDENKIVCNSKAMELTHSKEMLDDFKLKVTFPGEYNTLEYANLVDFIDIEIMSNQKI